MSIKYLSVCLSVCLITIKHGTMQFYAMYYFQNSFIMFIVSPGSHQIQNTIKWPTLDYY